jgi:ATP-binding cassette subfamily B protein
MCLALSAILALRGMITVGEVVLFNSFFMMMIRDISMLLNIYPVMARGFEGVRSMGEVLESPDLERNHNKRRIQEVRGSFAFDRVWFAYPEARAPAIRDFSLTVEAGQCLAFVGESGSGKTTLMNLLIGFRRPSRGTLLLDGCDMETLDLRVYREHISVVSQHTILFSGSVRDNVAYGTRAVSEARVWEALEIANAAAFVADLPRGLDTRIGEHGAKLSGGQRQRLAIARAIIRTPRVIIFDEATSSLDFISEKQVQEAINQLIAGRTTFIVAHRLSTIRKADRIVVMRAGRCVECGSYEELMRAEGEFYRLQSHQSWAVAERN